MYTLSPLSHSGVQKQVASPTYTEGEGIAREWEQSNVAVVTATPGVYPLHFAKLLF